MIFITISFSLCSTLLNEKIIRLNNKNSLLHIVLLNNLYLNEFSTILHLISLFIFTFLHFRFLTEVKRECQNVYLDRLKRMSKNKEEDWLSCRTLLISGIPNYERNGKFFLT